MLGDDALVLSHRLQEWCTHAPELEDELALANIGLDLLGQARLLLARAGKADGTDAVRGLVRVLPRGARSSATSGWPSAPNGDFAYTMARLLVFASWRLALLQRLLPSADPVLAAIAAKGVKEVAYHRDYAAQLGGSPRRRHRRCRTSGCRTGFDAVWPLYGELFAVHPVDNGWPASRQAPPACGPKSTRCWTRCSPLPRWSARPASRRWPASTA